MFRRTQEGTVALLELRPELHSWLEGYRCPIPETGRPPNPNPQALDALCRSLKNSKADTWQAHIRQACLEVVHSNKVYLIYSLQDASAGVIDERDICRYSSAAGRQAYLICGFQQQHSKLLIQKPPGHLHRLWRQKAGQV